jgi:hypothetical protein
MGVFTFDRKFHLIDALNMQIERDLKNQAKHESHDR